MDRCLVVDLEGTCGDAIPPKESETIEIGAVVIETATGKEIEQFQRFIKPLLHPIMTEFCKELTHIPQTSLDAADGFSVAMDEFRCFASAHHMNTFCSWGTYDKDQFIRDCERHNVHYPFTSHINLAAVFKKQIGRKRGSRGAMRYFGIAPTGSHHRGIDDARNIAKMVPYLLSADKDAILESYKAIDEGRTRPIEDVIEGLS